MHTAIYNESIRAVGCRVLHVLGARTCKTTSRLEQPRSFHTDTIKRGARELQVARTRFARYDERQNLLGCNGITT